MTEIKVPGFVFMLNRDSNNDTRRCACVRGASLGVFTAGRISLTLTGCSACVGGSVDCSDWPRSDCAVDFSPGEVGIGYIRPGLWNDSLIDAAPVTGSLVYSALFGCLIVFCISVFTLDWTFCGTDVVLLAGFEFYIWRVGDCRKMAMDGVALAEVRAGITLGVELYVPWDAPEAVVDISSYGVVPLGNVPDVTGLVGRREGAAENRVLQGYWNDYWNVNTYENPSSKHSPISVKQTISTNTTIVRHCNVPLHGNSVTYCHILSLW